MDIEVQNQQIALENTIICKFIEMNVEPQNALDVLGGGIIRALVTISKPLGFDYKELIQDFAVSLYSAEVKIKQNGNE